jgi:hypothetical protein
MSSNYRQRLADQQRAVQWQRFQATIPPEIWTRMTPAEQTQAWLIWSQNERVVTATRDGSRRITTTLVMIFVVPGVVALLFIISQLH